METIWIAGASGQLGRELQLKLAGKAKVLATGHELDILDAATAKAFAKERGVGAIINCAAYTDVERAEAERERCFAVNSGGVRNLSEAALECGAAMVHISTDFVFDGRKETPYLESDDTAPLNVYGESKLAGEEAMRSTGCRGIIIRTSWLYSPFGKNFMKTMLRLGRERSEVGVVCDQIGSPTAADSLAGAIAAALPQIEERRGEIFHYSGEGACSWSDFAAAIMSTSSLGCHVRQIKSDEYPQKATRPKYSYLDCSLVRSEFSIAREDWRTALCRNLRRITEL